MSKLTASHIVLAGGRSSRLDGASKPELFLRGQTLLEHALTAGAACCHQVVVGPPTLTVPVAVALVREEPPFGGPVAGIAAGLTELDREQCTAAWVLVTACDHPAARRAGLALFRVAGAYADRSGVELIAPVDSTGQVQNLFALYRREALRAALARVEGGRNVSVRRLVAGLATHSPVLPDGLLDDVDDPAAAAQWGISVPEASEPPTGQP